MIKLNSKYNWGLLPETRKFNKVPDAEHRLPGYTCIRFITIFTTW